MTYEIELFVKRHPSGKEARFYQIFAVAPTGARSTLATPPLYTREDAEDWLRENYGVEA